MYELKELKKIVDKAIESGNKDLLKELMSSVSFVKKDMPGFQQFTKAQNIIVKDGFDLSVYNDKPYLVTTQNQRYLDAVLPKDAKKACVILGAGDTLFELVSRNVTDIVALDINELQFLVYELKKASLMTLKAKDYERFLIDKSDSKFLSQVFFDTIKEGFDESEEIAYNFWQEIFRVNPTDDIKNHLFKMITQSASKIRFATPYLGNKTAYYELRKKLEQAKIHLEHKDALEYLHNVEASFDYIDITNIFLFFFQLECNNDFNVFKEKISILDSIYQQKLNNGGVFTFDYWFGFSPKNMYNYIPENKIQEKSINLYINTYETLSDMFNLNSMDISSVIEGIKTDNDTVLFTRKKTII